MKHLFLFFCLNLVLINLNSFGQCSLIKPDGVTVSVITSCDATLSWNAEAGASYYLVRYRFKNASGYTVIPTHITDTSYTFTNLVADSAYKFGVAAYCSNGLGSGYKNAQKTTLKVAIPDSLHVLSVTATSISVLWSEHCPVTSFNIRGRVTYTKPWTVIQGIGSPPYTLINLLSNTSYDIEVQAKNGADTSKWTKALKVVSGVIPPPPPPPPSKPNMIIFVEDDGRFDSYAPNGAPSWFNTPAINSIANEGINFVYAFPTTSQCAPSRVSIYSGLYASHHGAIDNNSRQFNGIPLVQQILHDAGYYTGFVGKYGQFQGDPLGFDWWATSDGNIYTDPPYKINGKDTLIPGHIADVYQSLALRFLNGIPAGKKFCLMFFTRIPHAPTIPRSQDITLYTTETMPFPSNFARYTNNYPSYLYSSGHNWTHDDRQTDSVKLNEFQCLYGAELNMSAMIDWLNSKNILDSTMIIFTSDNGYLEGEHKLEAKQLGLEESIRVPMFIRYPAWFPPGEANTTVMAFNIDIAPTLLDAAGIPDTFGMDGTSLYRIYDGEKQRKYFYYQFAGDAPTPPIRGIRSSQYIYLKTFCTQITEEFYDLVNDPHENTNSINVSAYAGIIQTYRTAMDSMKNAINDSDPAPFDCYLSNPLREADEESEEFNFNNIDIYPNPATKYFNLHLNSQDRENIELSITDLDGRRIYYKNMPNTNYFNIIMNSADWKPGLYLVQVHKGNQAFSAKLTIQ